MSKEGISIDAEKIKAINEWSVPKSIANIRSFMEITGYYHKFTEGFSKISYPITSLQKKGKKFEWTEKIYGNQLGKLIDDGRTTHTCFS